MKRITVTLLGACLALAACARPAVPSSSRGFPTPSSDTDSSRTVGVYASVIRQLVTKDALGEGGRPFERVYVIDGVVDHAENPELSVASQRPHKPFDAGVKSGLRTTLFDLPRLEFVGDRSSIIEGTPPGQVVDGGVIVTLGPIRGDGTTVTVGNSYWINGLAGQWLTYVVHDRGDVWTIAGTRGPIAIS